MSTRYCLREAIPEIRLAADLLDAATTAHLDGDRRRAAQYIQDANMSAVREWTESLWGKGSPYAPKSTGARIDATRTPDRMPGVAMQAAIYQRDGYHCRFCGIPVIRKVVRQRFVRAYPELSLWGRTNASQHAAFQCMWAQYDHVVPHSHGGTNDLENIVVTCAPCNYGRMGFTLEQAGLQDPRLREPRKSSWDGLERFRLA